MSPSASAEATVTVSVSFVCGEAWSTATEEMTDPQKTVPFAILRAGIASFLLYGGPILGILLVVPASQIQGLGGFIDAAKQVLTVYGGSVAADGTVTLTGFGAILGSVCAAGLIVGVLTSVAFLGEELGPLTMVGGTIVLVGLWLVEHRGVPAPRDARRRGTTTAEA